MSYISLSDDDIKQMLSDIGVSSIEDLFCCIPEDIRLRNRLNLPEPKSEMELKAYFKKLAAANSDTERLSLLGAGAYQHIIPSVVDYLSMRGEFVTPYTPYQPEVSQGTLQIIFEFQTLICQLTGLDIANASLYDGASGAAEAALMASRLKRKPRLLIARSLHPQYREVIKAYTKNLGLEIVELGFNKDGRLNFEELNNYCDDQTSALIIQSPNFFGVIEDLESAFSIAQKKEVLCIDVVSEAVSLGILEAPGKLGADIVTGEAQSLGMPLSYGGPFLGFMSCKQEYLRQFPGRIAGQTSDIDGKRGYVLTLSTREQHIRRERATSNICSNQAWCALRATIFMAALGREGLREMALQNVHKTRYFMDGIAKIPESQIVFSGPVFNEFAVKFPKPASDINEGLKKKGIIGGYILEKDYPELKNVLLFNITERHTRDDMNLLLEAIAEVSS